MEPSGWPEVSIGRSKHNSASLMAWQGMEINFNANDELWLFLRDLRMTDAFAVPTVLAAVA